MALTKWRMLSDGTGMYRPWGRTWPEISLFTGKVMMRDNNSKRPSQTIETDVITVENVTSLVRKHIRNVAFNHFQPAYQLSGHVFYAVLANRIFLYIF